MKCQSSAYPSTSLNLAKAAGLLVDPKRVSIGTIILSPVRRLTKNPSQLLSASKSSEKPRKSLKAAMIHRPPLPKSVGIGQTIIKEPLSSALGSQLCLTASCCNRPRTSSFNLVPSASVKGQLSTLCAWTCARNTCVSLIFVGDTVPS